MKRNVLALLAASILAAPASGATLNEAVRADLPLLMNVYRDMHANPELSMQEVRTPAKMAPEMRKLGFEVTEHVGKSGLIAVLRNGPGPVLMLRADMDALPVKEQTGLPFASKAIGKLPDGSPTPVMHACGHDTHIAAWLGTARRLAAMKGQWSGTLVMNLQSGEETGEGARAMLGDGLYTRFPKPNYVLAFHDSAILPAGVIGLTPGYTTASVDNVDIAVRGVGGHGASPQSTKDPIVLASRIVVALQTLVSREKNPLDPAVLTVGSFQGGNKHNVIPDEAKLQLTVRTYKPEVRKLLLDGIARIARGEAISAGVPDDKMPVVTIREDQHTPATLNSEKFANRTLELFTSHFGANRTTVLQPFMVGEDVGRYWLNDPSVEGTLFWIGGVPQAKWDAAGGDTTKLPSLHSPFWAPDAEVVISTATEAMSLAALEVLKKS
ncbi:amidohydrolase [Sphingomonas sp. NSE70-1]|uniref:Amidohydrolase n=1 Tax=Sphingomonas caseinilyticus TaxID=2908205 RepID=A0ABT0RTD1_9SPHN|nr:amidohydrolase [Sphingomonas caseinilyticus]MCL6698254.1 amidohydrolase [Sphingomonas caseinilyticus]